MSNAASSASRGTVSRFARVVGARYASFRRDVAMVTRSLGGVAPSPFVARRPATRNAGLTPRRMRVVSVVRETVDAVSLGLEDTSGAPIEIVAGQFFTLLAEIDGETHRRAYSACTSALDSARVMITAKRVAGGKVSTWLNDEAREGMVLELLGPSGAFTATPRADAPRHVVLVGGGSGITPLMAIARTLLAAESQSFVSLVYGNRRHEDVIFRDALAALAAEHSTRFALRHVLSDPPATWDGGVGVLDSEVAAREIARVDIRDGVPTEFYVCGPAPMMAAVREVLIARGVASETIHEERFASPQLRTPAPVDGSPHDVVVRARGTDRRVLVASGQTILEAGLAAGLPMPFSCAMGGCGACKVKVASGDVEMEEPSCLSQDERDAGYVLACVARPRSPVIVEVPEAGAPLFREAP